MILNFNHDIFFSSKFRFLNIMAFLATNLNEKKKSGRKSELNECYSLIDKYII